MPFTDFPPTVVFPDDERGWQAWRAWRKSKITVRYLCSEYVEDEGYVSVKHQCANRDPMGHKRHNLCYRCVAGFLYDMGNRQNVQADLAKDDLTSVRLAT